MNTDQGQAGTAKLSDDVVKAGGDQGVVDIFKQVINIFVIVGGDGHRSRCRHTLPVDRYIKRDRPGQVFGEDIVIAAEAGGEHFVG